MGRKRLWPPARRVHKGSERVYWMGRWHGLGPVGSPEAEREYRRLTALWAVDPHASARRADDLLVEELCRDYLASEACPSGRRQRERVVRATDLLCDNGYGHLPVAEFDAAQLESWQSWLGRQTDRGGRLRWNRTYIGHLVGVVRAVWKWGVRSKRTTWDQYHELRAVPPPQFGRVREPEEVAAADPAAVEAALKQLRPPTAAMVRLQLLTGARPDEVCGLTPADVLRSGRVTVPGVGLVDLDAEGVWVALPRQHKKRHRRKPRWLLLGPQSQAVLAPYLGRPPESYCFSPAESLAHLRAEQTAERKTRNGGSGGDRKPKAAEPKRRPAARYTTRTYRQAIARACVRAGVAHWFPHQLRHAAAAEIDFAFDLDHAQAALGHDKPDTTKRYAKRSFRAAAAVARQMG